MVGGCRRWKIALGIGRLTPHARAGTCASAYAALAMGIATPAIAQGTNLAPSPAPLVAQNPQQHPRTSQDSVASDMVANGNITRVTLTLRDSTVESAVNAVAQQAHLRVVFNNTSQDLLRKRVDVHVKNLPVMQALESVLSRSGLVAKLAPDGETVMIRAGDASTARNEEVGVVTGRVVDSASGTAIKNVTVTIQGTNLSAVTNDNGMFTIRNVPVGKRIVVVKFLGYRSTLRPVVVSSQAPVTMHITLVSVPTVLSGVVTTVTGTQQKLAVGNDITTINVDSVMRAAPVTSLTDLLETRVPGLTVMRTSGVPGAPSRLRLRGIGGGLLADGTGASNDPIVVVDGIRIYANQSTPNEQSLASAKILAANEFDVSQKNPYPPPSALDQIDPNSIETIQVFKGPSASAMYGSDAANGVIVITTKKGQPGATHWSMSVDQGVQYMPGVYLAPGYYPFMHGTGSNSGGPRPSLGVSGVSGVADGHIGVLDSLVRFQALDEPRLSNVGRGNSTTATATVSGGSQALTYSVTGTATNTLGLIKMPALYQDEYTAVYGAAPADWMKRPDLYKTTGLNAAFTVDPRPDLHTIFTTSITTSDQRQSSANLQLATLASQYIDTLSLDPTDIGDYVVRAKSKTTVVNYGLAANWTQWSAFPITGTIGVSTNDRNDENYIPFGIRGTGNTISDTLGHFSSGHGTNVTRTATFVGTLFPTRFLSSAVGLNFTGQSMSSLQGTIDTLAPGVSVPNHLTTSSVGTSAATTAGWFIEPRFNFNSRFFVNPGFRFDGGSSSGSSNTYSLFPKVNLSWIAIDRDNGAPLFGALTLLRPRLSFGVAGVQPSPGWKLRLASLAYAQSGSTAITSPSQGAGLVLTSLGNTELHPERSSEVEGGVDFELWGSRLTVTATESYKLRVDAIENLPVAPSVYGGYLTLYKNIGKVRNTSTEISVSAQILTTPLIGWSVTASVSHYTNVLVSLSDSSMQYVDLGNGTRLTPGYPLYGRWSRPILGYTNPGPGGRLSLADIAVGDSAVYVGQESPNFDFPISTSLSLFGGKVSVNATFDYTNGMTQYNSASQQLLTNITADPNASLAAQAAALAASCFLQGGTGSTSTLNAGRPCTDYGMIQTVNTLRFNNLSIGYNVPRSTAQRLFHVPSVSIALQGINLGLRTNYRGKDPDVNSIIVGDATQDSGQLPTPRTWRLQVRVGN
jgi:TonB-dependent SusC/RagA subfamily outer membrane receptor